MKKLLSLQLLALLLASVIGCQSGYTPLGVPRDAGADATVDGGNRALYGYGQGSASPLVTVTAASVTTNASPNGVNVLPGASCTVKLVSYAGVRNWSLSVYGTDDMQAVPPSLTFSVGPPSSYSFTMPNAAGRTLLLKSVVNGGYDLNGVSQPALTTTFGVFTLTASGNRVLGAGETFETSPFGWISDVNSALRFLGGTSTTIGGIYTSNTTLAPFTQWVPVNTASGSWTLTLPSPAVSPIQIAVTDTGFALGSHPLTVNGNGYRIYNVTGPSAGTLTNTFVMSLPAETLTFGLVPNDPTNGIFWEPLGDNVAAISFGGVYTANATLLPISQWVPVNTVGGSFTVTLPNLVPPIQIAITDTGLSLASHPLTINGGGISIWNPTGPRAGTLQATYLMNQSGATYVFNLVPNDPTNGTFWMPI